MFNLSLENIIKKNIKSFNQKGFFFEEVYEAKKNKNDDVDLSAKDFNRAVFQALQMISQVSKQKQFKLKTSNCSNFFSLSLSYTEVSSNRPEMDFTLSPHLKLSPSPGSTSVTSLVCGSGGIITFSKQAPNVGTLILQIPLAPQRKINKKALFIRGLFLVQ